MKYAKIENSKVKVYNNLPKRYNNIFNFQKSEIEVKNSKGFYELVIQTITEYQRLEPLLQTDLVGNKFIQRVYNFTQEEIDSYKLNKKNNLKSEYSNLISNIDGFKESIERNILDGTEIPIEILNERERLKIEYNEKINKL